MGRQQLPMIRQAGAKTARSKRWFWSGSAAAWLEAGLGPPTARGIRNAPSARFRWASS